ncbi:hypothetical protein [Nocardioides lijunqiniae]|uniref:hypothetical protein n=1 Tax=Nocardioides lijunqiniae TaxID=2760832 RepID=UPI00187772FD|nr:hypothetical protein [Nocardioides lijunqiniae]
MTKSTRIAAAVAGLTLSFGALTVPAATAADEAPADKCATQAAQLEKAEGALARVTAVHERKQDKVVKARKAVARADKANERSKAKAALAKAKEQRATSRKAKKAQVQRVAKATERLEKCEATQQPAA